MFEEKTVFILGAGASKPYGYPLGHELIKNIVKAITEDEIYLPCDSNNFISPNSLNYLTHLRQSSGNWLYNQQGDYPYLLKESFTDPPKPGSRFSFKGINFLTCKLSEIAEFTLLANKIKEFDPLSIDSFLRDHNELKIPGKIMICYCLLKCENTLFFKKDSKQNEDNWYRLLLNNITSECGDQPEKIFQNELDIITFNYDMSLEYFINSRLPNMPTFKGHGQKYADNLIEKHINHIHGKFYDIKTMNSYGEYRKFDKKESDRNAKDEKFLNLARLLRAFYIKDNINLIQDRNQQDKDAIKIIANANDIYIIGFGYDKENLNRIGFPLVLEKKQTEYLNPKCLYLLNYSGHMTNLYDRFSSLNSYVRYEGLKLFESKSDNIEHALLNDLKKFWDISDFNKAQRKISKQKVTEELMTKAPSLEASI